MTFSIHRRMFLALKKFRIAISQNHISSGFFYLVENLLHQNFWFPPKSSSNPVKSKSINQSKICSEFQRCTYNPFINYYLFSLEFQKKLQRTCLAGSSVPKPLKLTIKTLSSLNSLYSSGYNKVFWKLKF